MSGREPAKNARPAAPARPQATAEKPTPRPASSATASFALFTRPPGPSPSPPEDPRGRLGAGQPLDDGLRSPYERGFGENLAAVRLHTGAAGAALAREQRARAVTIGRDVAFAAGQYRPETQPGRALLAHELAHTLQQRGNGTADHTTGELEQDADRGALAATRAPGSWRPLRTGLRLLRQPEGTAPAPERPRRPRTPPPRAAPREVDPLVRFTQNTERLRAVALPAFQRALDAVDPAAVEQAGVAVLTLWATIEGAHAPLRPPNGPDLPEYVTARDSLRSGVVIQTFRSQSVVEGPARQIEIGADAGHHVATQTAAATATVKDTAEVVRLLTQSQRTYEEEEAVVALFRKHPNPWQLGYMRAAVKASYLEGVLELFNFHHTDALRLIWAAQGFLLQRGRYGPADRIGVLEPIPKERKVRVLQPYGPRELATEVYGDASFYETVLLPYNRGLLGGIETDRLVPAGTELVIDPQLAAGLYRTVFMGVEMMKTQLDRPYIEANPDGTAVAGTKIRYTLRWPVPPEPDWAARAPAGLAIWKPLSSWYEWVAIDWTVDNDPAAVEKHGLPATEYFPYQALTIADLTKKGSTIERPWPVLGTHTVRCTVRPHPEQDHLTSALGGGYTFELSHPQPVLTLPEKTEADWLTIADPRAYSLSLRTADTYGEFQQVAEELGVTEDELAQNPRLAVGLTTRYYPELFLRDLKAQLERTTDARRRKELGWQIDAVEKAIAKTKGWLRPIDALYVSGSDEQTVSAPLRLYLSPDFDAPRAFPYALRLWDFTLAGSGREYANGHGASGASQALHGLLEAFADEAPYPKGTVRFRLHSGVLPKEFLGDDFVPVEMLELHTHGGLLIEKVAVGLVTLGAFAVGWAVLGPGVALTAFAIYGGVSGLVNIITRLERGEFEFDLQTGIDLLGIAGALLVGAGAVFSTVRGVGQVAWLGTAGRALTIAQIGVMVGVHSYQVLEAIKAGDWDALYEALASAAIDGALFVVTHRAAKAASAQPGLTGPRDPVLGGGRVIIDMPEPAVTGRPATSVGVGGGRPPGAPPGEGGPPSTPRAVHEQWSRNLAETSLGPRPGVGDPAGPAVRRGTYETMAGERSFASPDAAFAAYDEAVSRAGGREVGIFRNVDSPTGEYVVRIGSEFEVMGPLQGNWETVLHRHPNPENVLTRRSPAPQDVQNTVEAAYRARRPITEFIDYPLPDGRRGLVAYTVDPANGTITIKYQQADGATVVRTFKSLEAYASHYAERTTYVDPTSPEYEWIKRDLAEFYGHTEWSSGSTAAGTAKSARPDVPGEVEGVIQHPPIPGARGRPDAPTAITGPPPGRGGALTVRETQELFTRAIGRHSPLADENVELSVDPLTYRVAFENTGRPGTRFRGNLPSAFTDPVSGRIWVLVGRYETLTIFHEAVHQYSISQGARQPFRQRYGRFLEEGITEWLTQLHLGPRAVPNPPHVEFIEAMTRELGVPPEVISRAYLDGQRGPLEAMIRAGFQGNAALAEQFVARLNEIGGNAQNAAALAEANRLMVSKTPPP